MDVSLDTNIFPHCDPWKLLITLRSPTTLPGT